MTKYKVVLIPFPFEDLSASKVRPAICLTEPIGHHRHVGLAFITSQIPATPLPTDLILNSDLPGFAATGLRTSSTIQVHRLMTVAASFISRELGTLTEQMREQVEIRLRALFSLSS